MKKIFSLPLLLIAFLACCCVLPIRAEEPPEKHMEFIRGLREKNLADLALEHLDKLKAKAQSLPPELAKQIPLEYARTQVSVALDKPATQRIPIFEEARKGILAAAKTAKQPQKAQLQLELAKLTGYQGQALMSQAYRSEKKDKKKSFALKARAKYTQGIKELDDAIKAVEDAKNKAEAAGQKEVADQLAGDLLQAKFDKGKTLIDKARTYTYSTSSEDLLARGKLLENAGAIMKEVYGGQGNLEISMMAAAWLIPINIETDNPNQAFTIYRNLYKGLVIDRKILQYPEAKRALSWAQYFYIRDIDKDDQFTLKGAKRRDAIIQFCKKWEKDFPQYLNDTQGIGIRYELALQLKAQAESISDKMTNPQAKPYYDRAKDRFEQISKTDHPLAEPAKGHYLAMAARDVQDVKSENLKEFSKLFLKARVEMFNLSHAKKEEESKKHLENAIAALRRSLKVAGPKDSSIDVNQARYYLSYLFLLKGDPFRAAVMGDYVARNQSKSEIAPLAASYAIQSYGTILNALNNETNRQKLVSLAQYVLNDQAKVWKNEPVTDVARYQLAMVYMRDRDYDKTISALEKLPKSFNTYTFSQAQLALFALSAAKQENISPEKKKEYREKAFAALDRIPELPADADAATAQMFFAAQLEKAKKLYSSAYQMMAEKNEKAAKEYDEMESFTSSLLEQFNKVKNDLNKKSRDGLGQALGTLAKYARFGKAELLYQKANEDPKNRKENYDKVLSKEYTGEIVANVKERAKSQEELLLPDAKVTSEILGLALRVHVQRDAEGDIQEAMTLLKALEKIKDPMDPWFDYRKILQKFIGEVGKQINDVKKKDPEKAKSLIQKFSKFFDALAKSDNLDRNSIFFLASSYNSIGYHEKAAKLFESVQEPKRPDVSNIKDEEEKKKKLIDYQKAHAIYWLIQVKRAEALRKSKKFVDAYTILKGMLANEKAVGKLPAMKEMNLIFEDKHLWVKAINGWGKLMNNPKLRGQLAGNPKMQEFYFDCYFHKAYCFYKYGEAKKEAKYVKFAASLIKQLEKARDTSPGWRMVGERFEELLDEHADLRKEYAELKAG